jgi:UDP-N-acetylmuramate: L-alanyl-gamma-D-glutamyl-meso-diaminopimelate ligase
MGNAEDYGNLGEISLPDCPVHVHLMGICGTGMGSLAGMFHQSGYTVTGSDEGVYPPMSDYLARLGITVSEGYSPENLVQRPDLVVVGNVIRRDNPEAKALDTLGIARTSMPAALNRYFIRDKTRVVVTGTHGKTTVSAMIAWILFQENLDPGFMIGGTLKNFRANHRLGSGDYFVIEGDEYDTAYFDKRPKFIHYRPDVAVITSCEFDHGDIYDSLDQIKEQFRDLVAMVAPEGRLIACTDYPAIKELIPSPNGRVGTYGNDHCTEWCATEVECSEKGMTTTVTQRGQKVARGTIPLLGFHNISNALAAIAASESIGVDPQKAMGALSSFEGVQRRQDVVGEVAGVLIIDDFAHHPTAVKETCSGVRQRFPDSRVVAVFEPRTNTSRRSFFQDSYVAAFVDADVVAVREPRDVERFPEGDRFSSAKLAKDLRSWGKDARAFDDTDGIAQFLKAELREGDVVLIMSNGSFDNIGPRLLDMLKERLK